ncbi:MAG: AAA family ATPase [Polyangiaceae bacterium]|nr:AAA family ATPase [Polyangiaceae bacterium]
MRFSKLVVESFQAIQRAEVEFGPGLNVLYGPNDLGKSTLATAIRAALLVAPSSAEASSFTPWYADATPRVSLTFSDEGGHHWKVNKAFGSSGGSTGAELLHSKDGTSFALDCKARQVEEKIRALLAWGIPAPGGKTGPRGLPTSFLANVLLGAQTDVDAILGKSLAEDLDGTGKLRLTNALATLAQDPLFKKVFDAAQGEVDQCFTATGKRKRGQTSKFTEAGQHVKQLRADLDGLQRQLAESTGIEGAVNALRERRAQAQVRLGEAAAALATVRDHMVKARTRDDAGALLDTAMNALGVIDAQVARVNLLSDEVDALTARVGVREEDVSRAVAECTAAESAVHVAEQAYRIATSEDGAKDRELRRAQLGEQLAELSTRKQTAQTRKTELSGAIATRATAQSARAAAVSANAAIEQLASQLAHAKQRTQEAENDLEFTRALVAYGRWRAASAASEDGAKAAQSAAADRQEAEEKDAAATKLLGDVRTMEEELVRRREVLPTDEEAKSLAKLERDLEMAEAALGGGLSVAVRPRVGVRIQAVVDQNPSIDDNNLATQRVFEAERIVRLCVGDVVDIEITVGAADHRRGVEDLRARWSAEQVPALARAGVESVTEMLGAIATIAKETAVVVDITKQAAQLRADAKILHDRAVLHEQQAAKLAVDDGDLQERKDAIGSIDPELLQTHLESLGKSWESRANALQTQKSNEDKAAKTQLATLEQNAKVAEYHATAAEEHAGKCASAWEEALAALGPGAPVPDELLRTTDEDLLSISRREAGLASALEGLAMEATGQVESAARAVEEASIRHVAAKRAHGAAVAAADVAKADLNARIGERNLLRAQVDAMDRASAAALCAVRETELASLPDAPSVSDADIANAERKVVDATDELEIEKEELHKSEGALSKVGGAAVRDEVERVQDALNAAEQRERDLEVDADAWKLLLDTLRDVENEEGAHLGRALAGPIATKFGELTAGRYRNLRLDAKLRTESVDVATGVAAGADVLEGLSVGTRDQLATLIRVTIADQLNTVIVLDDHLVHSDPKRLAWFREVLTKTALRTQVIVFTCRPEDYLSRSELPDGAASRDLAGGAVRVLDMVRVVKRWEGQGSTPPLAAPEPQDGEAQA